MPGSKARRAEIWRESIEENSLVGGMLNGGKAISNSRKLSRRRKFVSEPDE